MSKARDIASASPAPSTVSATELGYLDGVSSAIQTQLDGKASTTADIPKSLIDAKGDLIVGSANDTAARLAVGTNDYVLTADSSATNGVKWAAPAAGGKVLQVVSTTYSTEATSASGTYADTGVSLSITPSSTSSKVLIIHYNNWEKDTGSAESGIRYNFVRGSTQVWESYILGYTATALRLLQSFSAQYLDSPNTTSSTTYKVQFKNFVNSGTIRTQNGGSTAVLILMEIGA